MSQTTTPQALLALLAAMLVGCTSSGTSDSAKHEKPWVLDMPADERADSSEIEYLHCVTRGRCRKATGPSRVPVWVTVVRFPDLPGDHGIWTEYWQQADCEGMVAEIKRSKPQYSPGPCMRWDPQAATIETGK